MMNQPLKKSDLLDLQQIAACPPEVFAWRAGIAHSSLRRYAWEYETRLACSSYAEKKAWWTFMLKDYTPDQHRAFCTAKNLPPALVCLWLSKLKKTPDTAQPQQTAQIIPLTQGTPA